MNKFILFGIITILLYHPLYSQEWEQLGATIPGIGADDYSGYSIAISEDGYTVIIGDTEHDYFDPEEGTKNNAGLIKVYHWTGDAWVPKGSFFYGEDGGDQTGTVVDINNEGDVIAFSSIHDDGDSYDEGRVSIYAWDGAVWYQLGEDLVGESAEDEFGVGMSLNGSGDIIAIGSLNQGDMGEVYAGELSVFKWEDGMWNQMGDDINGGYGDLSGQSCALDDEGNTLIVGIPGNDNDGGPNAGGVLIYDWDGEAWVQRGEVIIGQTPGELTGKTVSINADGNIIAVAAPESSEAEDYSGEVRLYKWEIDSWIQLGDDISGTVVFDRFGSSLELNTAGNIVAIGAPWSIDGPPSDSWVGVFRFEDEEWNLIGEKIIGEETVDLCGFSVALNGLGDIVALSTPNSFSGHVRIFSTAFEVDNSGLEMYDATRAVLVYPNPVTDQLNVQFPQGADKVSVTIQNIQGEIALKKSFTSTDLIQLNLVELPAGVYVLSLEIDEHSFQTGKFTKI